MGQKVNPKIFRLGLYNNEWDSYYIEKNHEESTLLISNDIKIRGFLTRIFMINGLIVHNCKLRYTVESISISVSYFRLSNKLFLTKEEDFIKLSNSIHFFFNKEKVLIKGFKVFLKIRDINEHVNNFRNLQLDSLNKTFRRHLKDTLFEDLLKALIISLSVNNSSQFLVSFLILKLKSIKVQNKVLFYFKLILSELIKKNEFEIKGIKLKVSGRFNKSPRSRKKDIIFGSIPLQTIRIKIDYSQSTVFTSVGTFGVKLWICKK